MALAARRNKQGPGRRDKPPDAEKHFSVRRLSCRAAKKRQKRAASREECVGMREMSAGRAPRNIRTILLLLLPGRLMRFVGRAGERGGRGASPFSAIPLIRLIRIRPGR